MSELFLDANAHVPLNSGAIEAFNKLQGTVASHGNAMALSTKSGRAASTEIEKARSKIAELIGAKNASQIIFTSSATQACEWGLKIIKEMNFENVWYSKVEHPAVRGAASDLCTKELIVSNDGLISCGFKPDGNDAFVCMHVQNEIGTLQKIESIKVPFFCDMSQSLGKIDVNVSSFPNLEVAVFSAHKFGGPASVGFIYIKDNKNWVPFGTGSRYKQDRPGTPDTIGVAMTAAALEHALGTMRQRYENAILFSDKFEGEISSMGLDIIGEGSRRIPHTTFFKIEDSMGPYIVAQLEAEGIHVGRGSACTNTSDTNSTMRAIGRGGKASGYVRVSQWGNYTSTQAVILLKALKKYIGK